MHTTNQILSNLICFMHYTKQSHNLLILFSALNISFKTTALSLHFHSHNIPLRHWPYAFDNVSLPLDVLRFVFPQDSEDSLPKSDHPVKRQMFLKKRMHLEGVQLMLLLAGVTAFCSQLITWSHRILSKMCNKRHILCLQSHHTFTHFNPPNNIVRIKSGLISGWN